jgi:flagellin
MSVIDAFNWSSGETVSLHWTAQDGTEGYAQYTVASADSMSALLASINGIASFDGTASWSSAGGLVITADASGNSELDLVMTNGSNTYDFTTTTAGVDGQIKIHFGTGNESTEDYYYVQNQNMTAAGLGLDTLDISTQEGAQQSLATIDDAILAKDTGRAHFGAIMNRLQNTVSNLTIQAENIQAAESQISDVDVAFEMTNFMNTQIKAQAAVAMLSQANSLPQMAMTLLGG